MSDTLKSRRAGEEYILNFLILDDGGVIEWHLKKHSHLFCLESLGKGRGLIDYGRMTG